ncbi:MAG: hypothetical protein RL582_196 [Bacteroidota bacterium]|jgi:predicted short-subunit dehydrogenase-like oxidoreductase (DUF2520 family)
MYNSIKNISIIGSGNVASILGNIFFQNGFNISQIVSRNQTSGKELAIQLQSDYTDLSGQMDVNTDLFIIALPDDAISDCFPFLEGCDKLVVHTAASVSMEILKNVSSNYGVIYPLQSVKKEAQRKLDIPFFYCSNKIENEVAIASALKKISNHVSRASDEERLKYHVAAVFVCNFTNHLYAQAEAYCKQEQLDFKLLQPLIEETAFRLREMPPSLLQTGPAVRNDVLTMQKHLDILSSNPEMQEIYKMLSQAIINKKAS